MSTGDDVTFHVSDRDLRFLGIAAALSARWRVLHRSERASQATDTQAVQELVAGIIEGASLPLDDVPYIMISVDTDVATFQRLRELAPQVPARTR